MPAICAIQDMIRSGVKVTPVNMKAHLCSSKNMFLYYRADWEPAATSRRRVPRVFWRYPTALWGTIYTKSDSGFMETP